MSNFTKSIVYSTTVLAAGVVAIFAIYNNVSTSPSGESLADITPAAGASSIGIDYDKAVENVGDAIEASTQAATEKASELKDSAGAAMEPVKSKIEDAGAVIGETIEQAGESIEDTFTPEDTIEQIEPAHEEIKKQIKGSSGPHALPEKSGALHMQRSPYLILAGSNGSTGPGGVDIGNIDDILDQATKDAQARAGKHSKNGQVIGKADKRRLLKNMKDPSFSERNNKSSKKKKPMTQQAFIMQQALQAAQAKSKGQNPSFVNKKTMQQSLTKTVSLTTESQSKALITGNINALDFVQMAQDAIASGQAEQGDVQAIAAQAAAASAAAQQAANTQQAQADQDAQVAAASQQQAQQAQADLAAAQQATIQAQADLAAAQQATIQAQTDLANAQTAVAQAQAAEATAQTNAINADNAALQAEAIAAANPLDPALQQAAIDARAVADQAQLDHAAAQQTTINAQATETAATNNEAAAVTAEAAADAQVTAAVNAEAAAVTVEANASAQAAADAQVAAQSQAQADQLQTAADAAAVQAAETQYVSDQLDQVLADNPVTSGTDLNNATQQAGNITASAQAGAAGLPQMQTGQAGSLLEQAVTGAQTTVQQSSGNIVQAATQAAANSTGTIQQIVQTATDPESAKAAARGFLTGQISGAMGGAGLGSLTQGLQGAFAGAIGGDISTGVIISQVIQSVVSLPSEIIPIIPNIPFVGEVIGVLTQAATSLLGAALGGFPSFQDMQILQDYNTAVSTVGTAAGDFAGSNVQEASEALLGIGGSVNGAGSIVGTAINSAVTASQ